MKNVKHTGNITFDDIIAIARIMRPRSMAKEFKGTVKEMLGTAVSVGCTVDGEDPRELQEQVRTGKSPDLQGKMIPCDAVLSQLYSDARPHPGAVCRSVKGPNGCGLECARPYPQPTMACCT